MAGFFESLARFLGAMTGPARRGASPDGAKARATPRALQEVFEYSVRFNIVGKGFSRLGGEPGPAERITFSPRPRRIDFRQAHGPYRRDEIVDVPAYLQWSAYPVFAFLALIDEELEYRFGTNGEATHWLCPITADPERIAQIDRMFLLWYEHLGLPESLDPPPSPARDIDRSDKMGLIRHYLRVGDQAFLFKVLGDDHDDVVMWVDWREADDDIVHMCEKLIRTGDLTAEFVPNDVSADLFIAHRGVRTRVPYNGPDADRDTTLVTLNAILAPDHEIRMCRESGHGDTVAFLPLSAGQWQSLEEAMPLEVKEKFMKLSKDSAIFS
ncbi:hypothetical protein [Nitratireductor pacificus]|uniref:Uncharacterized protein n=1 Tax=Nitratireductor pacificus pht-3B TaxID=391937 RepID=K2LRT1_9HYPH|nr:hypothetical protein [Nitratireductor pacificus]EKF20489.1 hypothetical protein NA2_01854 [Nitratireductor pacificus pht-3B]